VASPGGWSSENNFRESSKETAESELTVFETWPEKRWCSDEGADTTGNCVRGEGGRGGRTIQLAGQESHKAGTYNQALF